MILPLSRYTEPIWKQKFNNIKKIGPEIKKLVSDMKETLEITGGVGLAAPQVGAPLRLFIVRFGKLNEVFINPKIISRGKEITSQEEGCLSVPRTWGPAPRSAEVEIDYQDKKGNKKRASLSGYYARIIQHEYDHLTSIFFTDRVQNKKELYTYKPIKIVFIGTPDIGSIVLKSLIGKSLVGEYEIPLVITAPDRPVGRSKEPVATPVKELANHFQVPVVTPETVKGNRRLVDQIKKVKPDYFVTISYGKILPKEILDIPKKAPLNIHFSLLPKLRGPSPIQTAILKGREQTGITIFHMNEKMDEGDILATAKLKIKPDDTARSLGVNLTNLSVDLVNYLLHVMAAGEVKPKPQKKEGATYTKILKKSDGFINLKKPPAPKKLERMIRAYYPWPGVWAYYEETSNKKQVTRRRILKFLPNKMVQLEGKQPIPLSDFKKGHKDFNLDW